MGHLVGLQPTVKSYHERAERCQKGCLREVTCTGSIQDMRNFALFWVLCLVACSSEPVSVLPAPPTMTVVVKPVVVGLPTLLDNPQNFVGRSLVLIAPVAIINGTIQIVPGFHYDGQELRPLSVRPPALWLAGNIPDDVKAQLAGGLGYLKLRGQLGPQGAYGPDAHYPYQFTLDGSSVLAPDTTTLTNLTTNIRALNDVLLKVAGTLLTTKDGAILTEQTGGGGIPRNDAHQIKLRGVIEPQLVQHLTSSGDVHYGAVRVVGWWHDGSLTPFVIQSSP